MQSPHTPHAPLILILFVVVIIIGQYSTCGSKDAISSPFQLVDLKSGNYSWYTIIHVKSEGEEKYRKLPCGAVLVSPEFLLASARCLAENASWNIALARVGTFQTPAQNLRKKMRFGASFRRVVEIYENEGSHSRGRFVLMRLNKGVKTIQPLQMDSNGLHLVYESMVEIKKLWIINHITINEGNYSIDKLVYKVGNYIAKSKCEELAALLNSHTSLSDRSTFIPLQNEMCISVGSYESNDCSTDDDGFVVDNINNVLVGLIQKHENCTGAGFSRTQDGGVSFAQRIDTITDWKKETICKHSGRNPYDICKCKFKHVHNKTYILSFGKRCYKLQLFKGGQISYANIPGGQLQQNVDYCEEKGSFFNAKIISEFDYEKDDTFYFKKYKNMSSGFTGTVKVMLVGAMEERGLIPKLQYSTKTFTMILRLPQCVLPLTNSPNAIGPSAAPTFSPSLYPSSSQTVYASMIQLRRPSMSPIESLKPPLLPTVQSRNKALSISPSISFESSIQPPEIKCCINDYFGSYEDDGFYEKYRLDIGPTSSTLYRYIDPKGYPWGTEYSFEDVVGSISSPLVFGYNYFPQGCIFVNIEKSVIVSRPRLSVVNRIPLYYSISSPCFDPVGEVTLLLPFETPSPSTAPSESTSPSIQHECDVTEALLVIEVHHKDSSYNWNVVNNDIGELVTSFHNDNYGKYINCVQAHYRYTFSITDVMYLGGSNGDFYDTNRFYDVYYRGKLVRHGQGELENYSESVSFGADENNSPSMSSSSSNANAALRMPTISSSFTPSSLPSSTTSLTPSFLPSTSSSKSYSSLSFGMGIGCVIQNDNSLFCWYGDHSAPVMMKRKIYVRSISMSALHVCIIFSDKVLKCYTSDDFFSTFFRDDGNYYGRTILSGVSQYAVSIGVGIDIACALLHDKTIQCWEHNSRKEHYDYMNLHIQRVHFGEGRHAVSLAVGDSHACAILNDSNLQCWGKNTKGQLGDLTTTDQSTPTAITLSNNTELFPIKISLRYDHSCAILNDMSLKCWGSNEYGQLGDSTSIDRHEPTTVDLGSNRGALSVALGLAQTCAILDDYSLKCWGSNAYGRIGQDPRAVQSRSKPTTIYFENDCDKHKVVEVSIGVYSACAILGDGSMYCWGNCRTHLEHTEECYIPRKFLVDDARTENNLTSESTPIITPSDLPCCPIELYYGTYRNYLGFRRSLLKDNYHRSMLRNEFDLAFGPTSLELYEVFLHQYSRGHKQFRKRVIASTESPVRFGMNHLLIVGGDMFWEISISKAPVITAQMSVEKVQRKITLVLPFCTSSPSISPSEPTF